MSSNRHERIQELFHAALAIPAESRASYLDDACGDDATVRAEVDGLLGCLDSTNGFMESSAPEMAGKKRTEGLIGRRIGPYRLVAQLGQGGMGAVYVATRDDQLYEQRVAIKLIHPTLQNQTTNQRFKHERQILAALHHPNIAQLLDGGTSEDGLPYLVMEYIEGTSIDRYCDNHGLDLVERLKLFRAVAGAVHYAHQNLVVHRDIKPANILVTAEGIPKLLDFGIAKLLNADIGGDPSAPTATALRMMTPEYASPEQVRGDPLTTATDVYSLGVLLFELLTDHRPYRVNISSPSEIERVVCHENPRRPSAAVRETRAVAGETVPARRSRDLEGDLDNIVLMALRKEPQRRYASVAQFSDDIRRYLENEPVLARVDTVGYRAGKFLRRHRGGAAALGFALVALTVGLVAALGQARIARAERARAVALLVDVRQLTNSLLFDLHDAIEKLPGATPARELVVRRALQYVDRLAREGSDDPALQLDLANAYGRLGRIQWDRYYAHLGDLAGGLLSQEKALALREAVLERDSTNTAVKRTVGFSHLSIGDALVGKGLLDAAVERYRQSLAIREALASIPSAPLEDRKNLSVSYQRLGDAFGNPGMPNLGRTDQALEQYQKMQAIFEQLAAAPDATADDRHSVGIGFEKLGRVHDGRGDHAGALEFYQKELAAFQASVREAPENGQFRRDLAVGFGNVGDALTRLERYPEAFETYDQARAIRQRLADADPSNMGAVTDLALIRRALGFAHAGAANQTAAMGHFTAAAEGLNRALAASPASGWVRRQLAGVLREMGTIAARTGHSADAFAFASRSLTVIREAADRPGATPSDLNEFAWAALTIDVPAVRNPQVALGYAQRAVAATNEKDPLFLDTLARAWFETGDIAQAISTQEQAVALSPAGSDARRDMETTLVGYRSGRGAKGPR